MTADGSPQDCDCIACRGELKDPADRFPADGSPAVDAEALAARYSEGYGEISVLVRALVADRDALQERHDTIMADVTSLRRELVTIFGVPTQRDGETWNAAMLRRITEKLIEAEAERDSARRERSEAVEALHEARAMIDGYLRGGPYMLGTGAIDVTLRELGESKP